MQTEMGILLGSAWNTVTLERDSGPPQIPASMALARTSEAWPCSSEQKATAEKKESKQKTGARSTEFKCTQEPAPGTSRNNGGEVLGREP